MLVESPGTAPGSDPRITGAFIAIVPMGHWQFRRSRRVYQEGGARVVQGVHLACCLNSLKSPDHHFKNFKEFSREIRYHFRRRLQRSDGVRRIWKALTGWGAGRV